jgi:hypothetical protein
MKKLALAAIAGSSAVFFVAAWDASRLEGAHDPGPQPAAPPPVAKPVMQPSALVSKAEVASAAHESRWTLRTPSHQALLFDPVPMIPSSQPARQAAVPAPQPKQAEAAITVPPGAPIKAATERQAPQARAVADKDSLLMTPARIARIKDMLRLSPEQEAHWAPVEAALREIGRKQLEAQRRGEKLPRTALSPDVTQQLYWSAGPLIMSLRPDQKQEARTLARSMGLEQVASLL